MQSLQGILHVYLKRAICQNALLNNDEIQNQGLNLSLLPELYQTTQIPPLNHKYLHLGTVNLALRNSSDQCNIIYSGKYFRFEIYFFFNQVFLPEQGLFM